MANKSVRRYVIFLAVVAVLVGGYFVTSAPASRQATMPTVKVALGPFYDYQLFTVAKQLGIDKQFGVNLDIVNLPGSDAYQQLKHGSVDVGFSCESCALPIYKNFPDLRDFMITLQFKGNVVIGRKGSKRETYDQLSKKQGGNAKTAGAAWVKTLKGSSWCLSVANDEPTLAALLSLGGLTTKDVHIVPFPNEDKGALAFIQGSCDYYFGSLPQEIRMVSSPELKSKFVVAGPSSLFPLNYSNFSATQEWLTKNQDTALRLIAIWFRATKYLYERPNTVLPIVAKAVQTATGGVLSPSATHYALFQFNYFAPFNKAYDSYYNPSKPTWEGSALNALFAQGKKQGTVPANLNWRTVEISSGMFKKLEARSDLVSLINAPIK
jgi:ABC-type nitrate/sulfonate/bicarbonate transport system substrate-binding protein